MLDPEITPRLNIPQQKPETQKQKRKQIRFNQAISKVMISLFSLFHTSFLYGSFLFPHSTFVVSKCFVVVGYVEPQTFSIICVQAVLHDHDRSGISSLMRDESDPRALAYVYQHQDTYCLFYIKTANLV